MPNPAPTPPPIGEQIFNGAKLVAELLLVPGASQILKGDVGSGIIYAGGGYAARYFLPGILGAAGWIVAALDSYSVSSSGRHIWEQAAPTPPSEAAARPE
jgi:hypothetical protein